MSSDITVLRVALLGEDTSTLDLAKAARAHPQCRLVAFWRDPSLPPMPEDDLLTEVKQVPEWESLLDGAVADVVVAAASGQPSVHADRLRKLVQAGISVLAVHPIGESILAYELEMIRKDSGSVLDAYTPARFHPVMDDLRTLLAEGESGPIGAVQHLDLERYVVDDGELPFAHALALDAELLRSLIGRLALVSAMGGDGSLASGISAQITSERGLLARWSLAATHSEPRATLRLVGTEGTATLEMTGTETEWAYTGDPHATEPVKSWPDADPASRAIGSFVQAVRESPRGQTEDADASRWLAVCRSLELAERAVDSRRRGKTLELYEEEPTEAATFKGVMAVGGCGILVLTFLVFLAGSLIEGLRLPSRRHEVEEARQRAEARADGETGVAEDDTGDRRWPLVLRLWPVYPFAAFLLLQLLLLILRRDQRRGRTPPASKSPESVKSTPPAGRRG